MNDKRKYILLSMSLRFTDESFISQFTGLFEEKKLHTLSFSEFSRRFSKFIDN